MPPLNFLSFSANRKKAIDRALYLAQTIVLLIVFSGIDENA